MVNASTRRRAVLQAAAALVIALSCNALALAQASHDHGSTDQAALKLDHGKRWMTDAPLRQGMNAIRASLGKRLDAAHAGRLTDAQFKAVAQEVNDQVAFIVKNCKLPPAADAVLHVVVAELIAAADAMEGKAKGTAPRAGFVKAVQALDDYGKHFDHPGWQSFKH